MCPTTKPLNLDTNSYGKLNSGEEEKSLSRKNMLKHVYKYAGATNKLKTPQNT